MPTEVLIRAWCDPCYRDGVHEEGISRTLGIDRAKPRKLILCERHQKELVGPLEELLNEMGAPVDAADVAAPSAGSGGVVITDETQYCKLCQPNKPLKNKSSLASHVRQYHEMYMHEYRDKVGEPQSVRAPKPGEEALFDRIETCDVEVDGQPCGKTYTGRYAPQQIGVHKAKKHGIKGPKTKPARA